jgi:DNA-binding CsgD family transcriptional regulator
MGSKSVTSSQTKRKCVVIQDRSRLFRESLALLLESADPIHVSAVVPDDEALRSHSLCEPIDAIVFEADGVPWDVLGLASDIGGSATGRALVGTYRRSGHGRPMIPSVKLVPRTASGKVFVVSILGGSGDGDPDASPQPSAPVHAAGQLTQRELQVLALISGGSTTQQIADRLGISIKTVENRRQSLFTKLGVQNQSHAVAVAMRAGLLGHSPAPHGSR